MFMNKRRRREKNAPVDLINHLAVSNGLLMLFSQERD